MEPIEKFEDLIPRIRKRKSSSEASYSRVCCNCKTVAATQWRYDASENEVCNPSGLYEKLHKEASYSRVCCNCKTVAATQWRYDASGNEVCNPCGLYEKLHKKPRPVSMRRDTIQTRKRKSKASQSLKTKNVIKMSSKNLEEVPVDHQHVPNYSLPPYQSIQMKTAHQTLPYVMPQMDTHPMNTLPHGQVYVNYRPDYSYRQDIYSPVSPNDIISVSSSVSDPSNGLPYTDC